MKNESSIDSTSNRETYTGCSSINKTGSILFIRKVINKTKNLFGVDK